MSVKSTSEIRFPDKQVIINFFTQEESFDKEAFNKIAEEGGCGPNAVEKVAAYFANKQIREIAIVNNVSIALQGFQDENEFNRFVSASDEYPSGDEMSMDQLQARLTTLREKANKVTAVTNPNAKCKEAVTKFTWLLDTLHGWAKHGNRVPQGDGKFYYYQKKATNQ